MKFRRLIAILLAMVLLTGSAVAVNYTDVDSTGYSWAKPYIDDMTERGLYNGYSDNTFRPGELITLEQALAVCMRACDYPDAVRAEVLAKHADDLNEIFDTDRSWFREEFALAVEAGLVTIEQLGAAYEDGSLVGSLTREQFTPYLVKAMQLLAPTSGWTLEFDDLRDIDTKYAGYVYTLNTLGIIVGDTSGNFNPKSPIKRADSATMFSRAVTFMEDNGLVPELEGFVDYTVTAGSIVAVTEGLNGSVTLTLEPGKDMTTEVVIPATAKVYEHNVYTTRNAMEVGRYAKVLHDADGRVLAVRMYSSPKNYSGTITALTAEGIEIDTGTTKQYFSFDDNTLILPAALRLDGTRDGWVGGATDEAALAAGYNRAECTVDQTDRLAAVYLLGGRRDETAIFQKFEGGVMTALDFGGRAHELKTAAGVAPTVVDGTTTTGLSQYSGRAVTLSIDNDTATVIAAEIDGKTDYIIGGLTKVTTRTNANTSLTVVNPDTKRETSYTVASNVRAYHNGVATPLTQLPLNSYVTIQMENGYARNVYTTEGTRLVEGEVTDIVYMPEIALTITDADGQVETVVLDSKRLPPITRSGRVSSVDKIMRRDTVTVTITYNRVANIVLAAPTADFTATVHSISIDGDGSKILLKLEDGTVETYTVASGAVITQDDKAIPLSSVLPGAKVGVVVSGTAVTAIDVETSATFAGEMDGTVVYVNTNDRTILLETMTGEVVTVNVPISVRIFNSKGETLGNNSLVAGDTIHIMGEYDATGRLTANMIIKK